MAVSMGMKPISAGVNVPFEIGPGQGGVLLSNESGLRVVVLFQGVRGFSRVLSAGMADFFLLPKGFNGNIVFEPSAQLTNVASWPSSYIEIEAFGPGERPSGLYPASLARWSTVGGNVNTVGGTANSIQNDGVVGGTQFIEATPSGGVQSTVTLDNAGVLILGNSMVNGKIFLNGTASELDVIKVFFANGSISRISNFTGTGNVNNAAHGLGATPDFIMIQYAGNFGTPPTQVPAWFNAGGTTVSIAAQTGYFWNALAIKF